MMKVFLLFISILSFSYGSEFIIEGKNRSDVRIKTGDIFEAKIIFTGKAELESLNELISFLSERRIGPFQVLKMKKLEVSPNNSALITTVATLALVEKVNKETLRTQINKKTFSIRLRNVETQNWAPEKNDIIILNQTVEKKSEPISSHIIAMVFLLIIVVLIALFFKKIRKAKVTRFDYLKSESDTRQFYESLYSNKEAILSKLKSSSSQDFFEVLDKYQYKEVWEEKELKEVRESYQKLRSKYYE